MKEPPLRTLCGGGSFVLRNAPERKVPSGLRYLGIVVRAIINLKKDGARSFRSPFCFASRHVGGGGDVHFCEYSAIEGPCIPTSGKKSGFLDVFYE